MSHPLYVALIWHQHQPFYKSARSLAETALDALPPPPAPGSPPQYRLPWVRLHGTKDYLDLVLLLANYPKLHQTVNLVPSLIEQIEDYVAGRAIDPYLELLLAPIATLTPEQRQFIIERCFDAHYDTLIAPHPRYAELYEQRQEWGVQGCLERWSDQDLSDLLAWHNLAWIDPLFAEDPKIAWWLRQGRDFDLRDRRNIWEKQRELLGKIVPQHRRMQESGQLEVITSPYAHPILPLLADTDSALVARPNAPMPDRRFQWPSDIGHHLGKARAFYQERFGRSPVGLWPSEQSVSPAILGEVARQGFRWLCSDEAVLGWTVQHYFHRDAAGTLDRPDLLYQPYRLATPDGDLAIVFRDHALSDAIGFDYGRLDPETAAQDLITRLEQIGRSLGADPGDRSDFATPETVNPETVNLIALDRPWLVTIALDGENCWEFYPQDGRPFLEALYGRLSDRADIRLVTVGEYLSQFPPTETLPAERLHSGSWVDGSFSTWIGDRAKNRGWELLSAARATLDRHPDATPDTNPAAWQALEAAEGSDWFWWFGVGHSSHQDAIFDRLFREHLCALYEALGEPVPAALLAPVESHEIPRDRHDPTHFIHPPIDGQGRATDWEGAGQVTAGGARGNMHRVSLIPTVGYGCDRQACYLRLDPPSGQTWATAAISTVQIAWYYGDRPLPSSPVPLGNIPAAAPAAYGFHHCLHLHRDETLTTPSDPATGAAPSIISPGSWQGRLERAIGDQQWEPVAIDGVRVRGDRTLEVAIDWDALGVEPGWHLHIVVLWSRAGVYQDHLPAQEPIHIPVPKR
jgi:alpha-amylase/alpha-mannosidase (GH57 family)